MRFVAAVIAACTLSGCAPEAAETPVEQPAVADTAAPSDEPTTAPALTIAQASAIPAAPVGGVSVDGWGAVRIGMTLEQVNALIQPLDPNDDPNFAEYQCAFLYPKEAPKGVSLMYTQGIIARIDVQEPGVATHGGLQVGRRDYPRT